MLDKEGYYIVGNKVDIPKNKNIRFCKFCGKEISKKIKNYNRKLYHIECSKIVGKLKNKLAEERYYSKYPEKKEKVWMKFKMFCKKMKKNKKLRNQFRKRQLKKYHIKRQYIKEHPDEFLKIPSMGGRNERKYLWIKDKEVVDFYREHFYDITFEIMKKMVNDTNDIPKKECKEEKYVWHHINFY